MYVTFPPPPPLARYVRMFWAFEYAVPDGEPYVYRSLADGCAEMVFHYKGRFSQLGGSCDDIAVLHAQTSRYRRFLTHGSFGIFGAYLYPSALPQLFGMSSPAFSNEMPALSAVCGAEGRLLEERIMTAKYHHRRVEILSDFLLSQLGKRKPAETAAHQAIQTIIKAQGMVNVTALAADLCLSTRQFERHFKTYAGFSAKTYARIIRFQRAASQYGRIEENLTALAYECGYYDQSHFIHDFKEFSGYHPRQYFSGRPEGIEYRE
jgi:AraC-like DNA-binding protein